jgi:hypothetical protein
LEERRVRFDTFSHLDGLLADFEQWKLAARELSTPNAEGDEFIRCAMIGFSRHLPLEHWGHGHLQYVRTFRDEILSGDFPGDWVRFACLAAGYFVGMADAGLITDLDLRLAEAHTSGFMWLHAEAFGQAPDDGQPGMG